ncbi:hypothetical protein VNO77_17249 [Canavalia gladiata]|uniref:Uncharacterized protein n=1 Tax=Canavalia gladiata TaxID=3824 RepID=A0AAN9LM95_CANGL
MSFTSRIISTVMRSKYHNVDSNSSPFLNNLTNFDILDQFIVSIQGFDLYTIILDPTHLLKVYTHEMLYLRDLKVDIRIGDASCHKYWNNVYARCITVREQRRYVEFVLYLFFPGCMITDVVLSLDHAHDLGEVYDADADAHDLGNDAKTPYADGGSCNAEPFTDGF